MPRSRPATDPLSFHKPTGQYYVTRARRRIYLGARRADALAEYHRLALGMTVPSASPAPPSITAKELANRFLEAQQANWQAPEDTLRSYTDWLERFLADHPRLRAKEFSVEQFVTWKKSLRRREFSAGTINHFLGAVRAVYRLAEDAGLTARAPRLTRVTNERLAPPGSRGKPLYTQEQIAKLVGAADVQVRLMVLLALNCGFGPKDVQDLTWEDFSDGRVTLPRSKTGVCQTFLLWPETRAALAALQEHRTARIERMAKRGRVRSDEGRVFMTKFWRPWRKDAVALQFRKLCKKAGVPCDGFYRLRHCASTAMSFVANPHVQQEFLRHSQLQQQVAHTHTPDTEVDEAVTRARLKLLDVNEDPENDPEQADVA